MITYDTYEHYPEDPNMFRFDAEVASIFDDMANRSIPLYHDLHEFAAKLAARSYFKARAQGRPFLVLDVGASTGNFFLSLWAELRTVVDKRIEGLEAVAIDPSNPMCQQLSKKLPHVECLNIGAEDLPEVLGSCTHYGGGQFDFVSSMYVFQFIAPEWGARRAAIENVSDMLKPGGVMVAANKECMSEFLETKSTQQYHGFRMQNGYTVKEIAAKSKALENAMWTEPADDFKSDLAEAGFSSVEEIFRWLQFAAYVAIK